MIAQKYVLFNNLEIIGSNYKIDKILQGIGHVSKNKHQPIFCILSRFIVLLAIKVKGYTYFAYFVSNFSIFLQKSKHLH